MVKPKNRISGITVRGFKSIASEQRLEIRPLTILAGANSAGKSSFMQPLLLLKQTLEAPGDPGALLLDGANVRFTMGEQLLSHIGAKSDKRECAVKIDLVENLSLELIFCHERGKGIDLIKMTYISGKEKLIIIPSMPHEQIIGILPPPWKKLYEEISKNRPAEMQWTVRRDRCFFVFELMSVADDKHRNNFGLHGISPSVVFVPYIQGIIHLPGLRGNPQRTYPKTAGGPNFPGTFEQYVASVIAQWQSNGGAKLDDLGAALEKMGLTWKVKAEPVDDTRVELKVGRLPHSKRGGAHDLVSIADVGFGVSQSLPVVVALLAADAGQLVYLEQPEIHLHPLAQRRLAEILQDAVARGVVVVVETHSALLLREIQTLVATNRLSKDSVVLHWIQRDEDGNTQARTANLNENGAYGNWPEDFDQTELEAEREYLDAVETKRAAK